MQRSCYIEDVDLDWSRNEALIHWRGANIEVETQLSLCWSEVQTSRWRRGLLFAEETRLYRVAQLRVSFKVKTHLSFDVETWFWALQNANLLLSRGSALAGSRGVALWFCQDTSQRILKRHSLWSEDAILTLLKWCRLQGGDADFSLLKRRDSVKRETSILRVLPHVWQSLKRHCSLKMQGPRSRHVATRLTMINLEIWVAYLGRLLCQ